MANVPVTVALEINRLVQFQVLRVDQENGTHFKSETVKENVPDTSTIITSLKVANALLYSPVPDFHHGSLDRMDRPSTFMTPESFHTSFKLNSKIYAVFLQK